MGEVTKIAISSPSISAASHDSDDAELDALVGPEKRLPDGHASVWSVALNLTNTTVGAGVLALPYSFARTGLVVGLLFLGVVAGAASVGHWLLVRAAQQTGQYKYKDLGTHLFGPRFSILIDAVTLLLTLGGTTAFVIIIGANLPDVLADWLGEGSFFAKTETVQVLCVLLVCLPLCLLPNLDPLRFVSVAAMACMVYLALLLSIKAGDGTPEQDQFPVEYAEASFDVMLAFPLLLTSYSAHYNTLPLYIELKSRRKSIKKALTLSVMLISTLYVAISVGGYLAFRGALLEYDDVRTKGLLFTL
eukprot:TRINITY_DN6523_c0_g1_i2.p1 TRINITY_DN6523_c0_g1~~TRINITY_DN6523_c0_g1_i2.p1  ORF type:complete len:311 (+),score=58.32 TRINITY_DN6523_c0_g1_i2:23-934(+)